MSDLAAEALHTWSAKAEPFAVATVVSTSGWQCPTEAPGPALALDAAGNVVGSVSGGCVEGAVYELCQQALAGQQPVLEHFGYSDEDALAVGLTCGGAIEVFVPSTNMPRDLHG
jgi:xanthine dehydrogenase accessory factor